MKHQREQKQEKEQQRVAGSAAFRCILAEIILNARRFSVLVRSLALVSRILLRLPSLPFFVRFFVQTQGWCVPAGKWGVLKWASAKGPPPLSFSASSRAPLYLTREQARESVCVCVWSIGAPLQSVSYRFLLLSPPAR